MFLKYYAQGKADTETNFVVSVGFTTKVDHQTTSKIMFMKYDSSSITAWTAVDDSAGIQIMSFQQGLYCRVYGLLRSPLW